MNGAQKAEIREVIAADCDIQGMLMNGHGQTCAVGGLAKKAKIADDRLLLAWWPMSVIEEVCEYFGLIEEEIHHIMTLNDWTDDQDARRKAILEYVDTIEVSPV